MKKMLMELRTKIEISGLDLHINHSMCGLAMGSCFAESIAQRMVRAKFDVTQNPFGVLYNPASIASAINRLSVMEPFVSSELTRQDDIWFSFSHHGSFSGVDPCVVLQNINTALTKGVKALQNADYVIITFGTAWTYRSWRNGEIVANCHKLPSSEFIRERLSVDQIVALYAPLLNGVLKSKRVLFTVSPIRHIKDGLSENSLSKATLRVAIEELTAQHQNAEYFPSYEIMIDELRDYRFYKEDMLHPTSQAVDYIWSLFVRAAMSEDTVLILEQIDRLVKACEHRPFNVNSTAHRKFCDSMRAQTEKLASQNPLIDFTNELNYFKL